MVESSNSRKTLLASKVEQDETQDVTQDLTIRPEIDEYDNEFMSMNHGTAKLCQPFIGKFEDAPEYHQTYNPHLKSGYRINYSTWSSLFKSLFQCHNETINVWTHFIGFWVVIGFFLATLLDYTSASTIIEQSLRMPFL